MLEEIRSPAFPNQMKIVMLNDGWKMAVCQVKHITFFRVYLSDDDDDG
jgi:hypothetical protein